MAESSPHVLNLGYIEQLHAAWRRDQNSVPPEWQEFFHANGNGNKWSGSASAEVSFKRRSIFNPLSSFEREGQGDGERFAIAEAASRQDRINQLIRAYRMRGHLIAQVHPIGAPPPEPPELDPSFYGFTESDLHKTFPGGILWREEPLTLQQILDLLRNTYCRSIGVQFMHIDDLGIRRWMEERMEKAGNHIALSHEIQARIFSRLTDAVMFEEFIRKKFLGAKSFSLEGCESLIPLLDLAIEKAGEQGVKEIVMGMAHRGRLNVLANILGKNPRQIFREFADADAEKYESSGDVKYHLGYSNEWITAAGKKLHLSLCFNPSHLEFVNTVALGRVRAKQDRVGDHARETCMTLLIHGDAALAGEGITQETLNLSQLEGYTTGGTLHVVVNNQIGFTTSPREARSCPYATDVARMLQVPIFHVNGEDPDAVAQCLNVAMDFRKQFKRDVFIDMYGYRKLGHNETDEPSFTQPMLYKAIAKRKPVREAYLEHLLTLGGITREEADNIAAERQQHLEDELNESRAENYEAPREKLPGIWARSHFQGGPESEAKEVATGVEKSRLSDLLRRLADWPENFAPHPKLERLRENWRKMADGAEPLDWAAAETLAYATLAAEGVRVRVSGQDSRRGTFSHRHAVLHDYEGHGTFIPLQHIASNQAPVEIFNSPLSEAGVLGFDYGFSLDYPDGLVAWEAQFGDFANAAQVIIDQFIASAEDKWNRLSGIVLLLPHGYEGQGPEHSSARLERFLQLCAEDNIQVCYPTTPAQIFHLLRRQALRPWRKPLVVMTPKSLLRLPECRSSLDELANESFQRVIENSGAGILPASDGQAGSTVPLKRALLCTGKIFYELEARRKKEKRDDVAIIRLEQLYPFNSELLEAALKQFSPNTSVTWVQEEPVNMGAWPYLRLRFGEKLFGRPLLAIARAESASPASGSHAAHKREQEEILAAAFDGT
jgi:2-oxoglutarate dehydrogenase E1 component